MTMLNFIVTFSGILGYIVPPIFFAGYTVDPKNPENLKEGDNIFMIMMVS